MRYRINAYLACLVITIIGALCSFFLIHTSSGVSYHALAAHATDVTGALDAIQNN